MTTTRRGEATVIVLVALAVVGIAAWLFKPTWLPGESRRAAKSAETTTQLVAANDAQGSAAAASVVKIGEANSVAPESPSKQFISSEVPVALSRLKSPDPKELIEAEKRRAAIMEGRYDEARKLYEQAMNKSATLQRELDAAKSAKESVDRALSEAAAANHARSVQFAVAAGLLLLALVGWAWAKIHGITPDALGNMVHDLKGGESVEAVFDRYTSNYLQKKVAKARKLAAP